MQRVNMALCAFMAQSAFVSVVIQILCNVEY